MKKINYESNIAVFGICLVLTVIIQKTRASSIDLHFVIEFLFGVLPSFLYVLGALLMIPVLYKDITPPTFLKIAIYFTLGACFYEISQLWTKATFDIFDVMASISALILVYYVYFFSANKR